MDYSIEDIVELWDKYCDFSTLPTNYKKFKDDHIFDEDKSVKWNREEVVRRNNEIEEQKKSLRNEKNKLYNDAYEKTLDFIEGILDNSNRAKAKKIFEFVMHERDSYRREAIEWIYDVVDFINEVNKAI